MKKENKIKKVIEPTILSANTYFWSPQCTAHQRRSNEIKFIAEVKSFFLSIGLTIIKEDTAKITAVKDNIEVTFAYSESCSNVYKHLSVYKNEKKSNITTLKKLYK